MRKARLWHVIIYLILVTSLLSANSFIYETVSGSLNNFRLDSDSSSTNPIANSNNLTSYESGEYWQTDGFYGRYVYQGEAITVEVNNVGPTALNTSANRFYYTRVNRNNGSSDRNAWREFFLVIRIKGRKHSGSSDNFVGANYIVEQPGDTFPITEGAGSELVEVGEMGYNSSGANGLYNGSNGYMYRYKYSHLWVDVTAIRTSNSRRINQNNKRGYYETYLSFTGDGIYNVLSAEGLTDNSSSSFKNPDEFAFGIERLAANIIPFTDLINKNTLGDSYLAGYLHFNSPEVEGSVGLYADSSGMDVNFLFSAEVGGTTSSIPYQVIFDPIQCGNITTASIISNSNNSFDTTYQNVPSIIGGQSNYENVLTGDIRIIVSSGLSQTSIPAATYSSTIYAIFEAD